MPADVVHGLSIAWALLLLVALAKCVEVIAAYLIGSLRLADRIAWVMVAGGVLAIPAWLWSVSPWLLLGLPISVAGGVIMGWSAVHRWRTGSPPPVVGYFVLGSPPDGVVNWVKR